jgi:hypothetical protein
LQARDPAPAPGACRAALHSACMSGVGFAGYPRSTIGARAPKDTP